MTSLPAKMEKTEFQGHWWIIHHRDICVPPCAFHSPSKHPMVDWPIYMRETGLLERFCSHGIGHPDPDSSVWMDKKLGGEPGTWSTHGCDGCCGILVHPPDGEPKVIVWRACRCGDLFNARISYEGYPCSVERNWCSRDCRRIERNERARRRQAELHRLAWERAGQLSWC